MRLNLLFSVEHFLINDKEVLNTDEVKLALHEYFEEHRQHVKLPDGRVALVTDIGR